MKRIIAMPAQPTGHWVGDGFPVRTLFSYNDLGRELSPFLMLDHVAPYRFEPAPRPRGVDVHPHRGFETVSIIYQGEVEHADSVGNHGTIGPGDVQWMTAASGILHKEFHSHAFAEVGGVFEMVQLWVNLPARDKMGAPGYQDLRAADIPTVGLPSGARLRVIAGEQAGVAGPARTFSPMNVWDLALPAGSSETLSVPATHNLAVLVLRGEVRFNGGQTAGAGRIVVFERSADTFSVEAVHADALLLILSGEPIDEPIAGYGPFVMNTQQEIRQAMTDFHAGKFGRM